MPTPKLTTIQERGGKIDRKHNVYAVCQYPNCPFEANHMARRLEFGWYDLCSKHMSIFRHMSLGDIRTTNWKRHKVTKI